MVPPWIYQLLKNSPVSHSFPEKACLLFVACFCHCLLLVTDKGGMVENGSLSCPPVRH